MRIPANLKTLSVAAVCSAILLAPSAALTQGKPDTEDKAIATRQGYMKLVVWEAGPLFGMAKGDIAYNAEVAKAHAANLKTISAYPVGGLFLPGTSKADRPGKTRALAEIWKDQDKFAKALGDYQSAVAALGGQVGNGKDALAAAVSELGKSCGGCHKPFRADEF